MCSLKLRCLNLVINLSEEKLNVLFMIYYNEHMKFLQDITVTVIINIIIVNPHSVVIRLLELIYSQLA